MGCMPRENDHVRFGSRPVAHGSPIQQGRWGGGVAATRAHLVGSQCGGAEELVRLGHAAPAELVDGRVTSGPRRDAVLVHQLLVLQRHTTGEARAGQIGVQRVVRLQRRRIRFSTPRHIPQPQFCQGDKSAVATVAKTKELKKRSWGMHAKREPSRQFWKPRLPWLKALLSARKRSLVNSPHASH